MIRKTILACLTVLMLTNTALAGHVLVAPTQVSIGGLGLFGTATRNHSPIVRQAGHACHNVCNLCRNDCYGSYRVNCYGPKCRQSFVLCMRACWNNVCRNC